LGPENSLIYNHYDLNYVPCYEVKSNISPVLQLYHELSCDKFVTKKAAIINFQQYLRKFRAKSDHINILYS